ncbi:MAG: Ger(x)C family spore germination protein [Desulfocucumaceae bacterium]
MRAVKLLFVLCAGFLLAGCWGSRETDEIAYVLAMGFDKGPGKNVIMTFQIANPITIAGQAAGGGSGNKNEPLITISTVAQLPIGAFTLLNTELSREISLLHTRAFIFSEEFAREGAHHFLLPLNRYRETRGTAYVYVCRGKAKDFMEANRPRLEISPSKQYELVATSNRLHSLAPVVTFRDFFQDFKRPDKQPVATLVGVNKIGLESTKKIVPGKLGDYLAGDLPSNKNQVQFLGAAVFKGDRMVGELTGDESRYLNMITGKMDLGFLFVSDPKKRENQVGMRLRQARKPVVKVHLTSGRPVIEVQIYQEPEIVGLPSGVNYESPELKPVLEKELANVIERRCREVITRTQDEFKSDIFGFGRYAKMQFLTDQDFEKLAWNEIYPTAELDINVHVKIRRTGLMLKTSLTQY